MKPVLSLLVAFVFLQVQSWALSGGPVYPGNATSLSGTYAGTITGEVFFDAVGGVIPSTPNTVAANGSGVFVIGQPVSGLASGVFAMFAGGTTYTGSVIAIADPGQLTMNGVMQGQANILETQTNTFLGVTTTSTVTFTEGILGISFKTTISTNEASTSGGSAGTRIDGTGDANFQGIDPKTGALFTIGSSSLIIDGFLQSSTVTSTVDLSALTNTSGGSGSGASN